MMDRRSFAAGEMELRSLAEKYFIETGKFDPEKEKHQRMIRDGMEVLERGLSGIVPVGRYAVSGPECFRDGLICLEGETLRAEAFAMISESSVHSVIPFIVTVGECECDEDAPLMDRFYAYMWGTAYADAAREYLEDELKADLLRDAAGLKLSTAFGPGFYGMDNKQSASISRILSADEIGITVRESGVMVPIKSCSGVFFLTGPEAEFPTDECLHCNANRGGCAHCMIRNRKTLSAAPA